MGVTPILARRQFIIATSSHLASIIEYAQSMSSGYSDTSRTLSARAVTAWLSAIIISRNSRSEMLCNHGVLLCTGFESRTSLSAIRPEDDLRVGDRFRLRRRRLAHRPFS